MSTFVPKNIFANLGYKHSMPKASRRLLFTLCLAALAMPAPAALHIATRPHPAPTRLCQISYKGWHEAFLLTNGKADVVVVPAIGRIMAYQLAGQPQTNALWNNPALLGKPLPYAVPYPARAAEWINYGGDKLWPAPQDDWARSQRQAGNWPPDPQMDYGPYRVSRIPNGLRLTGPVSDNRHLRPVRDIVLAPGSTQVLLREVFQRVPLADTGTANIAPALPLSLWNIAQARPDATVFVPLNPASRFPGGYVALAGQTHEANWHAQDGLLAITSRTEQGDKAGVDASVGWMGALYQNTLLFTEQCALDPQAAYPDQNTPLQVWSQGGSEAYVEMEALGPLVAQSAGQTITRTLTWNLRRLPRAPRDADDARRLVKSMLPPAPAGRAR